MSNTVQNTYENIKENDVHVENNIYETIDDKDLDRKEQKQKYTDQNQIDEERNDESPKGYTPTQTNLCK